MRRFVVAGIVAGVAAMGLSGCAVLLVGAGAAGGYAISKDSVKNLFDLPADQVFRVSREVVAEQGLVTVEDARNGLLKATVEGATVTVTVKPVTKKTVELRVKARDNLLFPKVDIAQALYTRILERLPSR
jgi:hypothetical protein